MGSVIITRSSDTEGTPYRDEAMTARSAFMQSREFSFYAGVILLPFLLVALPEKAFQVLILVGTLLAPPAVGLFAVRQWPVERALLGQIGLYLAFSALCLAVGFGAMPAAGLVACVAIDFAILSPVRWLRPGRVLIAVIVSAMVFTIIMKAAADGRAGTAYPIAYLLLVPVAVQFFIGLLYLKNCAVDADMPKPEPGALARVSLAESLEAALVIDRGGRVLEVSENLRAVVGATEAELTGRGLFERLHILDRPTFLKSCSDRLAGVALQPFVLRIRTDRTHPDTRLFLFESYAARLVPMDGDKDTLVLMLTRRQMPAAETLVSQRPKGSVDEERLDPASSIQARNLAEISHSVRTPLNAIIGFAEMLSSPETQPRSAGAIAEFGQIIHKSGNALLETVDILVDLVRVQSGVYTVVPEGLVPDDLLAEVESGLRRDLGEERISLSIIGDVVGESWVGDRRSSLLILSSVAAFIVDSQPTLHLTAHVSIVDGRIRFALSDQAACQVAIEEGLHFADNLLANLSPRMALMLELARNLAVYQGGHLSLSRNAQGQVKAKIELPLFLTASPDGELPIRLDDFRKLRNANHRAPSKSTVKMHA